MSDWPNEYAPKYNVLICFRWKCELCVGLAKWLHGADKEGTREQLRRQCHPLLAGGRGHYEHQASAAERPEQHAESNRTVPLDRRGQTGGHSVLCVPVRGQQFFSEVNAAFNNQQ